MSFCSHPNKVCGKNWRLAPFVPLIRPGVSGGLQAAGAAGLGWAGPQLGESAVPELSPEHHLQVTFQIRLSFLLTRLLEQRQQRGQRGRAKGNCTVCIQSIERKPITLTPKCPIGRNLARPNLNRHTNAIGAMQPWNFPCRQQVTTVVWCTM